MTCYLGRLKVWSYNYIYFIDIVKFIFHLENSILVRDSGKECLKLTNLLLSSRSLLKHKLIF